MIEYANGHYYSLNQYLRETFGCKVYKLALNGGYTCPNRDGTLGTRGCIFCSEGGSGEFCPGKTLTVNEQIAEAKNRVSAKSASGKYIAYFQSFTTTYMPIDKLEQLLISAASNDDICAVSVGTRPDCLPDNVLDLLAHINKTKPLWVELGLQTVCEDTAKYIRRGYSLPTYDEAVLKLRKLCINTIAHVIIGLPGETIEDMLKTAEYVGNTANGIKLQLLHVLKNTDLAQDYAEGKFSVLSQDEYIDIICRCIELLPEKTVIHRLTGDGAKRLLIAPQWSANKKAVLNAMNKEMDRRDIRQGRKYKL